MKTSELTGAALDWAVAKCEGVDDITFYSGCEGGDRNRPRKWVSNSNGFFTFDFSSWAQGGPIIEREEFTLSHSPYEHVFYGRARPWCAEKRGVMEYGPTPLIAAMRCYVASKLGNDVDVPEELTK